MSWASYKHTVSRYFPFSRTELKHFCLTVLVFAFILSFNQWGGTEFDAMEGFRNFIIAIMIVGVSVFIHHAAQRLMGLAHGYRIEHRLWLPGLLVGLLVLLLSNGKIMIFAASSMIAQFLPSHRLGAYRYGPSVRQIGRAALVGPVASVAVAFLLYLVSPDFFGQFLMFNLLFAAYNMLPVPHLDGALVFFGARSTFGSSFVYLFTVGGFIGFFVVYMLSGLGVFWSVLLAVLIGILCWFVFQAVSKS